MSTSPSINIISSPESAALSDPDEADGPSSGRKRRHLSSTPSDSLSEPKSASVKAEEPEEAHYELMSIRASRNSKFSLTDVVVEFKMSAMISEPAENLRSAIDEQIQLAITRTEEMNDGRKVEKFSLLLFGQGLDDPINLPLSEPPQNSADVLMAELDKLGQSEGEGDMDKRTLLLSHPVKMIVTCFTPPRGTGKRLRFDSSKSFGFDWNQKIATLGCGSKRLCLFDALLIGQMYHENELIEELKKKGQPVPRSLKTKWSHQRFCKNKPELREEVDDLMRATQIPNDRNSYGIECLSRIQQCWDAKYPNLYRIVAFDHQPEMRVRPIWKCEGQRRFLVPIFLYEDHWHAIKRIPNFFQLGPKYCVDCEASYDRDVFHRFGCRARCYNCSRVGFGQPCPDEKDVQIECAECHRYFFNQNCYAAHKPQTCRCWRRCIHCDHVYQHQAKQEHVCGTAYCQRCHVYHAKDTGCFIQKLKPKKNPLYRICVFDVETKQNQQLDARTRLHEVNYVSARIKCSRCADEGEKDDCDVCGPERIKDWSEPDGDDCLADFMEWLLEAFDKKIDTYVWSHNGARFDSHFAFNYLVSTGKQPEPCMSGLKIYEFIVRKSKKHSSLHFRDSYLLMGIALSELPATLGLQVEPKMHFPFLFNVPENYNIHLDHLPPEKDYCPESMSPAKYRAFKTWYDANAASTPFYLPQMLREYTRNDTEILLEAIKAFRRIFIDEVTHGIDLLSDSPTLASLCMRTFKCMFLQNGEIGLVPERGYERADRASVISIKYLEYRALREDTEVCHAGNGTEKRHNGYKLDGWLPEQNKAIEFLGCYYHGCQKCYNPTDVLVDGRTAMDLNERTRKRISDLKRPDQQGLSIDVEEIWECEVNRELEEAKSFPNDPESQQMLEFFDDMGNEKGPIDPVESRLCFFTHAHFQRMAYTGGRTGPLALHAEANDEMAISVFDIVSLYPAVQFKNAFPTGIPQIIRPHASETKVHWTQPDQIKYKGLLKVRVIPPRGLRIPVLPMKLDQRLLFACCLRCAKHFRTANTRQANHRCGHTDRERAFVTTLTHLELEESLRRGYVVDRFWRAWHYTSWSSTLFADYVRHFVRLKVQASGYPPNLTSEEAKSDFRKKYMDIGIELDDGKMALNPGLRYIAKICANSLWGKFSQRNLLGSNEIIREPADFYKLVYDHRREIRLITKVTEEAIRVQHVPKINFVVEHSSSNIVISLWTTSLARLALLSYMTEVHNCPNAWLLYTDTDSMIVRHLRGVLPIKVGDMLGEMQPEYVDWIILEYVCGGAKQYGLHLKHRVTGEEKFILRLRGITLDIANCQHFQYADFREMVLNFGREQSPAQFRYQKLGPLRDSRVVVRELTKRYLPVLRKGLVTEELEVLPFGFR